MENFDIYVSAELWLRFLLFFFYTLDYGTFTYT